MIRTISIICLSFLCLGFVKGQDTSVLSGGEWYKFSIDHQGIHQLTGADLVGAGIELGTIESKNIRIFGHVPGMQPQANSDPRVGDLREITVLVEDGGDGLFDSDDKILFYAYGPNRLEYIDSLQSFYYENHLYSNLSYYFLSVGDVERKDIEPYNHPVGSFQEITAYKYASVHEQDKFNRLLSGRLWLGETFNSSQSQTFATEISSLASNSEIELISSVISTSNNNSTFTISIDGTEVGTQQMQAVPNSTYALKGYQAIDTLQVGSLNVSFPLSITYSHQKTDSRPGYLDYFLVSARRPLVYYGQPTEMSFPASWGSQLSIKISNGTSIDQLWSLENPFEVKSLNFSLVGSVLEFNIENSLGSKLVAFNSNNLFPTPEFIDRVNNQNLRGSGQTDFLIVSPEEFIDAAKRLEELRESEGISTLVVTDEQVYNEFSGGKADITAIRDFAKHLFDRSGLQYVLLFGKGVYDNKNYLDSALNFLPIYQSRNSLHPLGTYGSDDYVGFLEDSEGEWPEQSGDAHTMEIGVGRIPVTSLSSAMDVVNKLEQYKEQASQGTWRKEVLFIAEDGDLNIHQRDAERLSTLIDTSYAEFNTNKIYIDAYPIQVSPGFKRAPEVNEDINSAIHEGTFIINYTGHGNERQWANSRVFDKRMISKLENLNRYPLFVTATCEFGRHDDVFLQSGAEDLVLKANSGAIGMITTSRPVFSSSNYTLNRAFYSEVFAKNGGIYQSLGQIFKETKNNSINGVLNRNFSLLGDPSMKLSYPNLSIVLDELNGQPIQMADTLGALDNVEIIGHVQENNGQIANSFNGVVDVAVMDRERLKTTLGNSGAPFAYIERDNFLFRGPVSVQNGQFGFSFIIPKNISYEVGSAKISLYAADSDGSLDAAGAEVRINLGGTGSALAQDQKPPEIFLYLNDTTFQDGDSVRPNSLLVAYLSDESGINISKDQIGHSLKAILDDSLEIDLTEYYSANLDDYTSGSIQFPINDLTPGDHVLSLYVWDTHNNGSIATIQFKVDGDIPIVIQEFNNYPNPMKDFTTLFIRHDNEGDDIEINFEVISRIGQVVYQEKRSYQSAPEVINDWNWDGRNHSGGKINEGVYIIAISLRSSSGNTVFKRYSRLIMTN